MPSRAIPYYPLFLYFLIPPPTPVYVQRKYFTGNGFDYKDFLESL
jgi:hypothetical protein